MIDLSTGSVNFSAKPAGSRENPVTTPLDWVVRLPDGSLDRPWVVNPVTGAWHSGPPVGSRAMWINPYRPVENQPPNTAAADFVYSIVFNAPSPGRIYLRGGSDDPGRVFLNGAFTGINIPGYALWPSNQPGWWVLPVSAGINNLTVVVTNSVDGSPTGLLIEAVYCSDEVMATTVTVTATTTTRLPGTTVTTRETTTVTTLVETTETTTFTLPPTTETQTETVMNPVNVTVYVSTTKTVPTTLVNMTTVRETTTQTTQQIVVTTATVQVAGPGNGPDAGTDQLTAVLNMPYSAVIISVLGAAVAGLGSYLVIKTKSVPPYRPDDFGTGQEAAKEKPKEEKPKDKPPVKKEPFKGHVTLLKRTTSPPTDQPPRPPPSEPVDEVEEKNEATSRTNDTQHETKKKGQ